ncbi:MAG: flagellar regulator YcgR PilZN domain-containing protein [Burkholderiales bacterium]|jgi:c-di-GMP-binding flagellar brake protein YcgR
MTSPDPNPTFSLVGQMLRTPEEITRVLNSLVMRGEPLISDLGGGKLLFRSRLRFVDPARAYIIIELSPDEAANKALLARPRATFHAEPGGWRVEFAAADPKPTSAHEGAAGIKLRFPEIVAGHRRRENERAEVPPQQALRCVVDEAGVMPFDGSMANVSKGGIGFLQYDPEISLEPGTVLKGCRIEGPGGDSIVVDMEVRYSTLITLADGRQVQSSGCRFMDLSPEETARIEELFGLKP